MPRTTLSISVSLPLRGARYACDDEVVTRLFGESLSATCFQRIMRRRNRALESSPNFRKFASIFVVPIGQWLVSLHTHSNSVANPILPHG